MVKVEFILTTSKGIKHRLFLETKNGEQAILSESEYALKGWLEAFEQLAKTFWYDHEIRKECCDILES